MPIDSDVSPDDIQNYYRQHREHFMSRTQVRWERMTAAFADFETEKEARAAIQCARRRLDGAAETPPAANLERVRSRTFHWTVRADVDSQDVARALFSMPVGRTSAVITDETGYHLVRVLERRGRRVLPVSAVREEIVGRILDRRRSERQMKNQSGDSQRPAHASGLECTAAQ